jgi:glycosyltransferase involved in cell wall biosynthesis
MVEVKREIVHVAPVKGLGGVQSLLKNYLRMAARKSLFRHAIWVGESLINETKPLGLNLKSYTGHIRLFFLLAQKNRVILWYNNIGSKSLSLVMRIWGGKRVILYERGTAMNASDHEISRYKKNIHNALGVIVNSEATGRYLTERFGVNRQKIRVVYNAVPFIVRSNRKSQKIKNYFIIGYMGRLQYFKGVHVLIDAFKQIKVANVELWIAGSGPYENRLREQAQDIGNIKFLGSVSNLDEFYEGVDLIVVPSIREPFGIVIIEAGFYRKPVIASFVDGIPEIIADEETGVLLKPTKPFKRLVTANLGTIVPKYVINPSTGKLSRPLELDSKLLAFEIESLLLDSKRRNRLANNLHRKVSQRYTITEYQSNLEMVISNMLLNETV